MELRQLKYFCVIAQTKSFSRASAVLRIAQPSLSRQIKMLEAELGVQLFVRDGRGTQLTPAGTEFFGHVERVDAGLAAAKQALGKHGFEQNTLTLGLPPSLGAEFMADAMATFLTEIPYYTIRLIEDYSYQLTDWIHAQRLDMAIVHGVPASIARICVPFSKEAMYLISSPSSAPEGDTIEFAQLAKVPLLAPLPPSTTRSRLTELAETLQLDMTYARHQADSLNVIKELVAKGHFQSVMTFPTIKDEVASGRLKAVRIVAPKAYMELSIATSHAFEKRGISGVVSGILRRLTETRIADGTWLGVTLVPIC